MSAFDAEHNKPELRELLAALREEILTPVQKVRLENLLTDENLLDLYIRYTALHADLHQFLAGGSKSNPGIAILGADGVMPSEWPDDPLNLEDDGMAASEQLHRADSTDAVFGYRMEPDEDQDAPEEVLIPPISIAPPRKPPRILQLISEMRPWIVSGAVAAMVLLSVLLWRWVSHPAAPVMVATLNATVDVTWEGSNGNDPGVGSQLFTGQSIRLTRGYVQFSYGSGASVILQGPAQARLDRRDRLTLDWGRVTATVPEPAHGFTVVTPAGDVVDLGTEFGVDVSPDQVVQVQVFRGHVKANPANDPGDAVTLAAGEAAQINTASVVLDPTGGSATTFIRDIHQVTEAFTIHSTGQGLAPGSVDPHWTLNLVKPDDAHARVLSDVDSTYVPNSANAQWISVGSKKANYANRWYTFTTTFNLTGFDASTARLSLGLAADNFLAGIRLNGRAMNSGLGSDPRRKDFANKTNVVLDSGFNPGYNQLQILVLCVGGKPMGLLAEASGTAVKIPTEATTQSAKPVQ